MINKMKIKVFGKNNKISHRARLISIYKRKKKKGNLCKYPRKKRRGVTAYKIYTKIIMRYDHHLLYNTKYYTYIHTKTDERQNVVRI